MSRFVEKECFYCGFFDETVVVYDGASVDACYVCVG